ncbi:MAG: hypothetical protein AMJ91_03050 [candidate division Zixibacteria bacterium SM23_73_3]|nr:MAG: hypothetical protein AMJ91_03050 [candidate division Zixibacteria bacterium SM23_73_3]
MKSKTKLLIILAIAVMLVWGSSYLFLPDTGAQKSADQTTASRGAYPYSTVAAKPDKVEGYQPPRTVRYGIEKRVLQKREGGEDCASATPITSLPSYTTGYTCDNVNDYDEVCPYSGSTAKDVVYSYAPGADETVNIDLGGSYYDTKVYVYEDNCVSPYYACNDDYYPDYTSAIMGLDIYAGHTYYIVVDGYGSSCGDYVLSVESVEPCDVVCPGEGIPEDEPVCTDNWEDIWNGGCNSDPNVFEDVNCDDIICGTSGTYDYYGSNYRDTDWFRVTLTDPATLTWKVVAEFPLLIFVIEESDCAAPIILGSATADMCDTATLAFEVPAGVYWLWVGPSVFEGVPCGKEYVGIVGCEVAETGACCYDLDPYTCTMETPEDCAAMPDHTFLGLGTNCGPPNPCLPGPDNDDCEDAVPVTPGVPVYGTNIGATIDCPGVLDWNAVWYTFELPYDCNDLFIDFCPTDGYIYTVGVVLYDECPPDCPNYILRTGYQWVTCTSGWDNPQIWWNSLPGGTYWFPAYVEDESANPMDFGFEITVEECPGPPPNDDCVNAEAVGDVVDLAFNTDAATNDGDGTCMSSPNIWYCYTATCTGDATVSLCGSDYDTKLAVYDGCTCDPLGTEIECNDDYCGLQSQITFLAEEGHEYLVEVGGYSSNTGDGILNIYCVGADQGACCNDLEPYDCQVLSEAECNVLPDHTFLGVGTDCDPNPCVPGNTCDLPIEVELPLDLPYMDRDQYTCGRGDNYDATCLGYYDGGEDIIYELNVTEAVSVMITFDPKGTTWNGIALDDACPLDPSTCLYTYTQSGSSVHSFEYDFGVGTYYIQIDTWPSPDCIPDFDLTIDPLGPEIEVTPASFEEVLNPDPPNNTADETMNITNTGYEDLNYDITEDPEVAWLSCSPTSGTVLPGLTDPVTVSFDASGMGVGDYYTDLVVTSNALTDPVVTVPVHLVVELPPDIDVDPSISMGVLPGCSMPKGFRIDNLGEGELRYEISVEQTAPPLGAPGPNNIHQALEAIRKAGRTNPDLAPKEAYKIIGAKRLTAEHISTGVSEGLLLSAGAEPQADILLVDDDGGLPGGSYYDIEDIYMNALDAGGYIYDYYVVDWTNPNSPGPDISILELYNCVIWFCGETWGYYTPDDTFIPTDEANVAAYLDGGGNFFLSAQDYLWDVYPSAGSFSPGQFPYDYLHLASVSQDVINDPYTCAGLPGSVAEGMSFQTLRFTDNPDVPLWTDYLYTQSAAAVDVFDAQGGVSAIQYDAGNYKVIFTTTPFPGLVDASPSTRAELMASIVDWFGCSVPACPFIVTPDEGTIPPDSFFDVVLTFDGEAFEECVDDIMTCYLVISSNDPIDPVVSVQVDMWSGRGDVFYPPDPCVLDLGDVLFLINYVLKDGPAPDPLCMGDCDPSHDGMIDLADVVYLIQYLYEGGMPPVAAPETGQPSTIKQPAPMERK